MILNNYILRDSSREIDEMEEEFQLMYLASTIVDGAFNYFNIERKTSNVGKPPFDLRYDKTNLLWIYKQSNKYS